MNKKTIERLESLGACQEAVGWSREQPNSQQAWDACEQPEWMLWLLRRTVRKTGSAAHRRVVLLACDIAATALRYVPKSEKRPAKAIRLARRWARGDARVTIEMVWLAADAAAAVAAYAAAAADAAAAAAADAAAADAADAAAEAAYAYAYAAAAAAAAYYTACAHAAAGTKYQRTKVRLAGMIRRRYPKAPRIRKAG